jgi:hypothetical protein
VIFIAGFAPLHADAGEPANLVKSGPAKVAIKGYDPVAYFTEGRPMHGAPEFSHSWNDAQWLFVSSEQRDMFAADPERYAPKFGGHCSMALTRGEIRTINPAAWAIVDGRLYLSSTVSGINTFRQDNQKNIEKAEQNWAKLQTQ